MAINVVTSCSADGYEAYGRDCVESFVKYWPESVSLHVVSEHDLPQLPSEVRFHALYDYADAGHFLYRHQANEIAHGQRNGFYDYRFDACKFSKKVFATALVARYVQKGRLFWMDADCRTHVFLPFDLLLRLPPPGYAVAHFSRVYYSECGFIGYDLDHPQAHQFIADMADTYASDAVFSEAEWHDSWVWDRVRERNKVTSFAIPYRQPSTHPLIFSELGKYMDHRKGPRKKWPVSPEHPIYGTRRK